MIAIWLNLAFMPVCAVLAGTVLWLLHRDETLEDGALVRNFIFFLVLAGAGIFLVLRADAVRVRIDPVYRIESAIAADALYATIEKISADDAAKVRAMLAQELASGATLPEAWLGARAWLAPEVRRRTGWVDQATRLEWARYETDMLKKALTVDATLCFRLMTHQPLDRQTLVARFSPAEHHRFHELAVRIYEASDAGMQRRVDQGEAQVDFNDAAREFGVISQQLQMQYGAETIRLLRSDTIGSTPPASQAQVCSARVAQLEAMLSRPRPMASRLVDSVLR